MKKLIFISILAFAFAPCVNAAQWQILGTRAMGMGGAYVGVAEGPVTQYWNPAGLVKHDKDNYSGMAIPIGVNAEVTGKLAENAGKVADMAEKFKDLSKKIDHQMDDGKINADDVAAFLKTISILKDIADDGNKGILADINAGIDFKMSKVSFSINNFTTTGFTPSIDTQNIGLGATSGSIEGVNIDGYNSETVAPSGLEDASSIIYDALNTIGVSSLNNILGTSITDGELHSLSNWLLKQARMNGMSDAEINKAAAMISNYSAPAAEIIQNFASGDNSTSYKNNQSTLHGTAASLFEISAGYAWDIRMVPGLSVGANLKMIDGMTVDYTVKFMEDGKTDDFDYDKDVVDTWRPAADIGVLWNIGKYTQKLPFPVRAGIVARNINSPKFKYKEGGSYTFDRQIRAGISSNPYPWWTISADIDITKNDTMVEGFYSRQAALGMEFNLVNRLNFNLPLRLGLINNIAESDSKMAYTAGIGLHLIHFQFDVSALMSSNTTEYKDKKYPVHGGVAAQLAILF